MVTFAGPMTVMTMHWTLAGAATMAICAVPTSSGARRVPLSVVRQGPRLSGPLSSPTGAKRHGDFSQPTRAIHLFGFEFGVPTPDQRRPWAPSSSVRNLGRQRFQVPLVDVRHERVPEVSVAPKEHVKAIGRPQYAWRLADALQSDGRPRQDSAAQHASRAWLQA